MKDCVQVLNEKEIIEKIKVGEFISLNNLSILEYLPECVSVRTASIYLNNVLITLALSVFNFHKISTEQVYSCRSKCTPTSTMGTIVSAIAFPYPPKEYSETALRNRQDLKFLKTKQKLSIPIIHIKKFNSKYTVIYSHGNAEDVGLSLDYLDELSDVLNANIIAYEYPGYSIADGKPSEDNCYEAIDAAYDYAIREKIHPSTLVLFGRSLGTGPTVDLCSRKTVAGCILQSPLESGIRCFIGVCSSYTLYPLDIFRNYATLSN